MVISPNHVWLAKWIPLHQLFAPWKFFPGLEMPYSWLLLIVVHFCTKYFIDVFLVVVFAAYLWFPPSGLWLMQCLSLCNSSWFFCNCYFPLLVVPPLADLHKVFPTTRDIYFLLLPFLPLVIVFLPLWPLTNSLFIFGATQVDYFPLWHLHGYMYKTKLQWWEKASKA